MISYFLFPETKHKTLEYVRVVLHYMSMAHFATTGRSACFSVIATYACTKVLPCAVRPSTLTAKRRRSSRVISRRTRMMVQLTGGRDGTWRQSCMCPGDSASTPEVAIRVVVHSRQDASVGRSGHMDIKFACGKFCKSEGGCRMCPFHRFTYFSRCLNAALCLLATLAVGSRSQRP